MEVIIVPKVQFKEKEPRKIGAKMKKQGNEPRLKWKNCMSLHHAEKDS